MRIHCRMAILSFSLSPVATSRIYELLICLSKFGETVSLEARHEKLTITALNSSRTAYASFVLDAKDFFLEYVFKPGHALKGGDRFTCQLLNKALQSAFKGRSTESRGRDSAFEHCDVAIQDQPDEAECRLIVKLLSNHGMTKTYRLTYESVEVMHALFDRTAATQGWRISARVLREYIEYFGPRTEQLDMLAQEGKALFTSFTEKIQNGKEVLKQPLETAITINTEDFEDFHMQEDVHVVISVKDFRAIVTHAETLRGSISAQFSAPNRPLQFSYENMGLRCEFTLMTTGEWKGASSTKAGKFISTRPSSRQPSVIAAQRNPEPVTAVRKSLIHEQTRPFASQNQRLLERERAQAHPSSRLDDEGESLFMPDGGHDDDRAWDPTNYEQDEEDEMLGWDASHSDPNASFQPTLRDSGPADRTPKYPRDDVRMRPSDSGLEPTQPLSQLRGMFD